MLTSPEGARFHFDAGALCMELLTTGGPGPFVRYEALHEPEDLARWLALSRLRLAPGQVSIDGAGLATIRGLRDAILRTARAHAHAYGGAKYVHGVDGVYGADAPARGTGYGAAAESKAGGEVRGESRGENTVENQVEYQRVSRGQGEVTLGIDGQAERAGGTHAGKRRGPLIRPEDLETINRVAAAPPLVPQIGADGSRTLLLPVGAGQVASTIARDAVALFTGPLATRVRECSADNCYLVFVDASRPGRRRWCSMERCGNRNKVRALRARVDHPR